MSKKIILLFGPTASGKSKLAIDIAEEFNGEIINADSMQVYKELKILSARPSKKDLKKIKHHLYGFQSIKKKFSTGKWLKLVNKKIMDIKKKKKIPIIVGGTGLYFKSLIDGLVKIPLIPEKFRKNVRELHGKKGSKDFFLDLIKIDPLVKKYLKPSDTQRIIRAYEVKKFTKKSIFEWFRNTKSNFNQQDFFKIYIDYPRDELIRKINTRIKKMIKKGAISEVKKFISFNVSKSNTVNKAIGIHEIKEYLGKKIDIEETIEKISVKTRQYAKRQVTWARGNMLDWNMIKPNSLDKFLKKIYIFRT